MVDEQHFRAEEEGGLGDLIDAFKRRRKLALTTAGVIIVLGVVVIFAWPSLYSSTATILLEEPEVPQELVQTTVTTFAAQQIQYINQRVMTRTNLANIIEKFDLYAEKREYSPTLLLTEEVRKNIKLDLVNVQLTNPRSGVPMISTIAFTLGFEDKTPATAQKVANELVSLYMEENVRSRTVQTVETREFLSGEGDRLEERVQDLEEQIARFKEENEGSLPLMTSVNLTAIQRIDSQILDIDRELNRIDETLILLDAQLIQVEPTTSTILPDGSAVMSPESQLKSLQTRLASLKGVYSDEHPDVRRTGREIDALKKQTGLTSDLSVTTSLLADARIDLAKARENYSNEHPEVVRLERLVDSLIETVLERRDDIDALIKPDNPAYIQLNTQKETLVASQNALRTQKKVVLANLVKYEALLLKAPSVEQGLISLERQLQSATGQYFAMRERQFGAEMGEALESQSKGERFVLVEPPDFPLEPSSPNREVLMIVLIFLAPALGFGLVPLKESMDHSIWGAKMLDSIQGAPPIAEIPLIVTRQEAVHARRVSIIAWAGAPLAILLVAISVHFLLRPLDVLWYVAMRKLGM
ncbi:MAG: hypothetical protein QGH93_00115 [Gammaproteobacteria bacterium]|jgi:uncharacterized protein involved in exopolysaccharide biosynthesis|nr:hypothetical protein [Chromatiales bacterium]MDP6673242.1 hypothetical protein [Gammaproteobacteria bacterium]